MKKIILFTLLASIGYYAHAQIRGKVIDSDNNPVELATIILQTKDSVYVNSVYSDSLGEFSLDSNMKDFRLIVQHLLYNVSENSFSNPDIGIIRLEDKAHSLGEVVVKGERPIVSVKNGRMTYDMERLTQDKVVSNAYESLLQLPGIHEQDGALSLAGANGVSVIINGKPTSMTSDQLMELLKNMPKERIDKAEVMYSAPAQYHIRGAAINLVLKGGVSETPNLQGQVNASYSQFHYADFSAGTTLLYSTPKFSTDFMYSFGYLGNRSGMDLYSKHLYKGTVYDIEQHNSGNSRTSIHNIRLGNDFLFDNKSKLSLVYTAQIKPWQHATQSSKGTFSESTNKKEADTPIQMHNVELSYTSKFGLDAGANYTFYKSHTTQTYKESMIGKEDAFNAQTKQNINRLSAYIDQTHSLPSEWQLNYGGEFMYASDNNSQTYQSRTNKDLSGSDSHSRLKEYTYNLYGGFEKTFTDKFALTFSLTGEYYNRNNYNEWSLFPSLEATYTASPSDIWQLSLSSDKTYPDYWTMANSISYMNGYTELHGNPDLRPYKDYSMQLNYIMKSKYIFSAYINYSDDYFVQLPYQASDRLALIYKTTNFDYDQKFGVNAIVPFSINSFLSSRITLNGFYHKTKSSHFHDMAFENDNLAFYANLNNTINISSRPNIKMEVGGSYISKNIQGPSSLSAMYKIDAGIKWLFAGDKAELRLKVNDIFNSWSPDKWSMKQNNQNLNMHIIPDLRYINISFSYKFGGYKDKKHKDVDTSRFGK